VVQIIVSYTIIDCIKSGHLHTLFAIKQKKINHLIYGILFRQKANNQSYHMLKNYLVTGVRALRRASIYGILNITGLALGIACAALIFLWVEDELSFDHQYPKHNEIYSIRMNLDFSGKIESFTNVPGPMPGVIKESVPGIVNLSRLGFGRELFALQDKSTYEQGLYVDTGFFSMMQPTFIKGNAAGFTNPHTLVITEKMAQKFFGATDPVGKTLQVDNQQEFVVIGVVKDPPPNVSLGFDWLAPVDNYLAKNRWLDNWGTYGIGTMVELQPNADTRPINQQLTAILRPKNKLYTKAECILWSMNDWHLRANYVNGKQDGGQITYVRLFAAIAWIILIIACINFMNLSTARAGQRAREIGVRKTLGALRHTLISQFLVETLLLSFIAVLVAVLLVYVTLPAFNMLVDKQLPFDPLTPSHLMGLLTIGALCGLIAGSYPAFYLSGFQPVAVLKGLRIGPKANAGIIRRGLVVTQFAISVILIVCTVIIYQQIQHVKDRDLGYNKQDLLWTWLYGDMVEHFGAIRTELLQTGVVEDAALSNSPQLQMWSTVSSSELTWAGSDPNNKVKVYWESASPEYLSTMGLQLTAGRHFHADILSDSDNVIINESMASLMGEAGRVGSVLTFGNRYRYRIIGVVKNYLFNNMYESFSPLIMTTETHARGNYNVLNIRLKRAHSLSAALDKIEAVIKSNNPGYPFDYQFANEQFDQLFRMETRTGKLAGVFAVLAIVISCLGLFGLAAYTAERRTKEIGIRKILGASASGLVTMMAKEFIQLVAIACLIAFPLAWMMMNNYLADYAYRTAIHWWVFGVTGITALFIALLTVSFQAIKTALANPVRSLRSE
jgi:putative ABC transport system permease protein